MDGHIGGRAYWNTPLRLHINSKHKGVRYKFQSCEYESSYIHALKEHVEKEHLNVTYVTNHFIVNIN